MSQVTYQPHGARRGQNVTHYHGASKNPFAPDSSTPKFANHDAHVAAVLAQGGFTVLNVARFRK